MYMKSAARRTPKKTNVSEERSTSLKMFITSSLFALPAPSRDPNRKLLCLTLRRILKFLGLHLFVIQSKL